MWKRAEIRPFWGRPTFFRTLAHAGWCVKTPPPTESDSKTPRNEKKSSPVGSNSRNGLCDHNGNYLWDRGSIPGYMFLSHTISHRARWSYYVTLLIMLVYEVFVFCFGCYWRAQYFSWVVHQTIVGAFKRYLFPMNDIFRVSSHICKL